MVPHRLRTGGTGRGGNITPWSIGVRTRYVGSPRHIGNPECQDDEECQVACNPLHGCLRIGLWGTGKFILGSAGARCLICYVRLRMDQTAGDPIAQRSADKARAKQKGL